MNATYIRIDLVRQLREVSTIVFIFLLPVLMYLLFGANTSYGDEVVGDANVKFYVMMSMAAYGACTAAVSIAGTAATESLLGWGRQVALTRQPASGFVLNKIAVAVTVAAAAEGFVMLVGRFTGAHAAPKVWALSYLVALLGSTAFAAFGIAAGTIFKSEQAVGIASSMLVLFAFLGNVFTPLTGTMLKIAHYTPMYGYIGLVRWPQMHGDIMPMGPGTAGHDSFWTLAASLVVWTLIFVALAVRGAKGSRGRQ